MADMPGSAEQRSRSNDVAPLIRAIAGYLNFSNGQPDTTFQSSVNEFHAVLPTDRCWDEFRACIEDFLTEAPRTSEAFADCSQATAVLSLVFEGLFPAYRQHHSDLLFHLDDDDFRQPFFLARLFEAVLAQGPPWNESERIVAAALDHLNDFLGYRPLAVLENGRKVQPYSHERFRPIPLYIRGAGVAWGKYHDLIAGTLELLESAPANMRSAAHFELDRMDELALDVRSHDHEHPANKRTNYMFGEWDPHLIDSRGQYRRFVLRKIILDALLRWLAENESRSSREEALYDVSALLCGTMLMASAISGSGPDTHDSSVTLSSLLPLVAQQRDTFYEQLLRKADGPRATRLRREAQATQQPFGHVRQSLNLYLAHYGARQVQHRHLAQLYARMGHPSASREQASAIPCAAARFHCEIHWRITTAHWHLNHGELPAAVQLLDELDGLFHRGIDCGAIVDPWNILGFQGYFPLFSSREDSIPDPRVEILVSIVEGIFSVCSRALGEAAVQQESVIAERVSALFRRLTEEWDRFATTVVEELPHVSGGEIWKSAQIVSRALSDWRAAGESSGDISFWRDHVEQFDSAQSYAQVVETLLEKNDVVAAMGLLMQWLSQAEEVGFHTGPSSLYALLVRWLLRASDTTAQNGGSGLPDLWKLLRRLFDYLEANAGSFWSVPTLEGLTNGAFFPEGPDWADEGELDDLSDLGDVDEEEDEEDGIWGDPLYRAAYEDVVFRESALDGNAGDVLDDGSPTESSEIELITRYLEPHLRFLGTLAQLWEMVGTMRLRQFAATTACVDENAESNAFADTATIETWLRQVRENQQSLIRLLGAVWDYSIPEPSGDHDSNIEYDYHLQTKFHLTQTLINTVVEYRSAERCLMCCLPSDGIQETASRRDRELVRLYHAMHLDDHKTVSRLLPRALKSLTGRPLLYVSLESGGHPNRVLSARTLQMDLRFMLRHLTRLGLLRETWHVLRMAHRLERTSRVEGLAVTEFDRLFRIGLRGTIECLIVSSQTWNGGKFPDADLIELLRKIVDRYSVLWREHSRNMRLSSAEALQDQDVWNETKRFIEAYGKDLFHARFLTLGNVRSILHNGVDWFLDYLEDESDPLVTIRLLEDLEQDHLDRQDAIEWLELIYQTVVDEFDRFLEYNTTTTQSDYGEKFHCLLEFLRVEAAYTRDAWNLIPFEIAHECLTDREKMQAARLWREQLEKKTRPLSETHLVALHHLEKRTGMHLPSVSDHLNERFVRPLAVNRMLSLVPKAIDDLRLGRLDSQSFHSLSREIDDYLNQTAGSSIDVPDWLQSLDQEVKRHLGQDDGDQRDLPQDSPSRPLSHADVQRQLDQWDHTPTVKPRSRNRKNGPTETQQEDE